MSILDISSDWKWLTQHIILLALVVALSVGGIYSVESIIARHDALKDNQLQTIATQITQQNAITQQQTQAEIAALTQQNIALQTQVGTLATAITTRDTQLKQTQKTDATLPPTELAAHWQNLITMPNSVAVTPTGYTVTPAGAVGTVQALDSIPVLTQDKTDLANSNKLFQQEVANDNQMFSKEQTAHQSDNATCTADKNALNGQISTLKADARKNHIRDAFFGAIAATVLFLLK